MTMFTNKYFYLFKNLLLFIFCLHVLYLTESADKRWFCHFDDDNYVNVPRLVHVLQKFNYVKDWYLGKTSVRERVMYIQKIKIGGKTRTYIKAKFWFGTGGAGYCISKSLALKMKPKAAGGKFVHICEATWFPDDVTMGYLIEHLLGGMLTVVPEFHSHIEPLSSLEPDTYKDQVSFSYNIEDRNLMKIPGFNAEDDEYDPTRWFCHFDDDNYVNVPRLLQVLQKFNYLRDWYLGKTSVQNKIGVVEKVASTDGRRQFGKTSFWFATGGAGYCISRALALKMSPFAGGGKFISVCERIKLPDDVTMGYIIEHVMRTELTVVTEFHSHLERLGSIVPNTFKDQITFSYYFGENGDYINIVNVPGFDDQYDQTRFLSLHCFLFPHFNFCPR